jgi:hypothetical protein
MEQVIFSFAVCFAAIVGLIAYYARRRNGIGWALLTLVAPVLLPMLLDALGGGPDFILVHFGPPVFVLSLVLPPILVLILLVALPSRPDRKVRQQPKKES